MSDRWVSYGMCAGLALALMAIGLLASWPPNSGRAQMDLYREVLKTGYACHEAGKPEDECWRDIERILKG